MQELHTKKANVLIVDDVVANLVVLTEMIKQAGYIARPVTSVKQANTAIQVCMPQLILLDISMPDMDGFEWCEILKKNPSTRDIPIIFISGLNSPGDKIRGFKLGAVDFICKPFEIEEVTLRVNTHIKNFKMQQELEIYNQKLQKLVDEQMIKIQTEQKNLIFAMARISQAKDRVRTNHIENVAYNSKLLAIAVQIAENENEIVSNEFIETISLAAPLHDIGKIAIPDSITQKEEALSEEETAILRRHAKLGAQTLKEAYNQNEYNEFLKMAIDIAYYHHEKWDGTGYPKGLIGHKIPLSARIVAVVDSYDKLIETVAKSNQRPPQECHEAVMSMMRQEALKSFDPILIELLDKIQRQLKR